MMTHSKFSFSTPKQTLLLLPFALGLASFSGYADTTSAITDLNVSLVSSWIDNTDSNNDCARTLVYQLRVTNNGPNMASGAEVRGHLLIPNLLATWSCSIDGDTIDNSLCYDVTGSGDINTKVALSSGRTALFSIQIPVAHDALCQTFTYQAQVASTAKVVTPTEVPGFVAVNYYQENDPNLKDNYTELSVSPAPDVTLTLQAAPTAFQSNVPVTMTSFVSNQDLFCPATGVIARYEVPSGVQISQVSPPSGWSYTQDGNALIFQKDTLDPKAIEPIQFTMVPGNQNTLEVTGKLTTNSTDPNLNNNQSNQIVPNIEAGIPELAGGGFSCNISQAAPLSGLPSAWMGIALVTFGAWWRTSKKIA